MVDDDDEDIYMTRRAFCSHQSNLLFDCAHSGAEMFDYLHARGEYASRNIESPPGVILLDINIPKENGFAILQQLRDSEFSHIPVTIHTTSSAANDIQKAYQLGACSYICKSASLQGGQEVAKQFCDYWFGVARLPIAS